MVECDRFFGSQERIFSTETHDERSDKQHMRKVGDRPHELRRPDLSAWAWNGTGLAGSCQ